MGGISFNQSGSFSYPMIGNCVHVFNQCAFTSEKSLGTLKRSSGHVKCSFDNPAENFLSNVRTLNAQSPKKIINNFFKIEVFPQNGSLETQNAVLTTQLKTFCHSAEDFLLKFQK